MALCPSAVKCMSLDAAGKIFFGEKMNAEFIYWILQNILLDIFMVKASQYSLKHG